MFMLFQLCIALTYFALPRSFPDFYFIPKSANNMFAFFLQETKKPGICGSYFLAFPRILRQKKQATLLNETFLKINFTINAFFADLVYVILLVQACLHGQRHESNLKYF
jgi:hypothetical protein